MLRVAFSLGQWCFLPSWESWIFTIRLKRCVDLIMVYLYFIHPLRSEILHRNQLIFHPSFFHVSLHPPPTTHHHHHHQTKAFTSIIYVLMQQHEHHKLIKHQHQQLVNPNRIIHSLKPKYFLNPQPFCSKHTFVVFYFWSVFLSYQISSQLPI